MKNNLYRKIIHPDVVLVELFKSEQVASKLQLLLIDVRRNQKRQSCKCTTVLTPDDWILHKSPTFWPHFEVMLGKACLCHQGEWVPTKLDMSNSNTSCELREHLYRPGPTKVSSQTVTLLSHAAIVSLWAFQHNCFPCANIFKKPETRLSKLLKSYVKGVSFRKHDHLGKTHTHRTTTPTWSVQSVWGQFQRFHHLRS